MMTAREFIADTSPRAGFWRVRVKAKAYLSTEIRQETAVVAPFPPHSRDGVLSPPPTPDAVPAPTDQAASAITETDDSPKPRAKARRVAAPVPAPSKTAGTGATTRAERNKAMVAAYEAGASLREVGENFGMAKPSVYTVLKNAGVAMRPVGKHHAKTPKIEANSPSLPGDCDVACHEAVVSEERNPKEDRTSPEGDRVSSGSTATAETPESSPVRIHEAVAETAAKEVAPPTQAVDKPKFKSWVEDYVKPEEKYDPELVRRALSMRGRVNLSGQSPNTKGHATTIANIAEREAREKHRREDPFERAKSHLQRLGPVFSATYRDGPAGMWFVDGQRDFLTDEQVIELAKRKGWAG